MRLITIIQKNILGTYASSLLIFSFGFRQVWAAKPPNLNGIENKTLQQLITDILIVLLKYTLTFLVALTVVVFMWGMAKYIFKGQSSDTARTEGRKLMLWGVIGLFVMTSVWGLVALFTSLIGHTGTVIPQFR